MERILKSKWTLLIAASVIGLFLDYYTKLLAVKYLTYGHPVNVLGEYLQFLLIYNKGAIFGLNPRQLIPSFPVNTFFIIFSSIAMVFITIYYRTIADKDRWLRWGLAFIMPGALGNFADRIVRPGQGVVDFIKMGISQNVYWPIYNLADAYVTIGVGLILLGFILESKKQTAAVGSSENRSVPQSTKESVESSEGR